MAELVKNLPATQETQFQSLGREDPLERNGQPTPVFLPEEFHGQRSQAGYSPWDYKESGTTVQLTHFFTFHTHTHTHTQASVVAQTVKNLPAVQETQV